MVEKESRKTHFFLLLFFKMGEIEKNSKENMLYLTYQAWEKIKDIKRLDLQLCSYCGKLNILNLGWEPFGKWHCEKEQKEHVLCWELCYKVCLNVLGCELVRKREKRTEKEVIKTNKNYDWANCYLCQKELKGASKKGIVKNRNNPLFWGINSIHKILCLECLGKRHYFRMNKSKKKTWKKYLRRGYV